MPTSAKILFVAAELTPLAKSGGLADVVGALPIALRGLGSDAQIIIPKYEVIDVAKYGFTKTGEIHVTVSEGVFPVALWTGLLPNSDVPVTLLESAPFLSRGGIYFEQSGVDRTFAEFRRFLFFTRAVEAWLRQSAWQPDVLHVHDWEAALLPLLTERRYKSILTLHNLAIQGVWNRREVEEFLQLAPNTLPSLGVEKPEDVNILGIGMTTADAITTVSPSYAQEIRTPEFGMGLETIVEKRSADLVGILNGIDVARFNPAVDPDITPYDTASLNTKHQNREPLLKRFGLTGKGPIFSFVGRLTEQKGIDLVLEAADTFAELDANLIILGKGIKEFEAIAQQLPTRLPGRAAAVIGFDAALAQQLYAGSDIMLVPSRFEPCGLVQMIALRYGTPALVRATGGLKDTVKDGETGVVFTDYTAAAFAEAVRRAAAIYQDPDLYQRMQQAGMAVDFSWTHSAKLYADEYQRVLSAGQRA